MNKNLVVVFVFGTLFVLLEWPSLVKASESHPRPRFEIIYEQGLNISGYHSELSVIHDKESGQEVVCSIGVGNGSRSCWTTGRSWK